ncbi:MAG: hypothetical protein R2710_13520 [Acidimicrobiales bacterium]
MGPTDDRKTRIAQLMARRDLWMLWVGVAMILLAGAVVLLTRGGDGGGEPVADATTSVPTTESTDDSSADTTTTSEAPREPVVYVSPDGSDTAAGQTADTAVASLEQAFAVAVPGDEIRLLPGTYPFTQLEGSEARPRLRSRSRRPTVVSSSIPRPSTPPTRCR